MFAKQETVFKLMNQICSRTKVADRVDIQINDGFQVTQRLNGKFYFPSKTGKDFHDDDSFFKVMMGPFGSGKSVTCCHEILLRTINMPKCIDGVRRAKWCIVRNTYRMLEISTVRTWLAWFEDLGEVRITQRPPYFHCKFNDNNGPIELELIFLALDRPGQLEGLKSAEFTGAWLNELSGLQEAVFQFMKGRINGRYPSASICHEPYWSGIIADTNPPNTRSWIYRMFEQEKHPEFRMFKQPPGLIKNEDGKWVDNPNSENRKTHDGRNILAADYYQKMTLGASEEYIKVFCLGEYGSVLDGKPVYPEYNDDTHSMNDLAIEEGRDLYLGWDFGLTPACIILQKNVNGRLHVVEEVVSFNMDLRQFLKIEVMPLLNSDYRGCNVRASYGDPAGANRSQTDSSDCLSILNEYGLNAEAAPSQDPLIRQRAVHDCLNTMIDGRPRLIINRDKCFVLREGFQGGYQYRRIQTGQGEKFADTVADNEYTHIHDALQYVLLGLNGFVDVAPLQDGVIHYPNVAW